MMVHSELLNTLVPALVLAFAFGFVAVRLGLPPLVGYLIAGVAIGPYTPGGSADASIAAELAEVGVVLLMFGVGLHFSLRDLVSVRVVALPGAFSQIAIATGLGFGMSRLMGWTPSEGLILGLALSVASTVVLLRALDDRKLLDSLEGRVAVGWLVIEDLFTVLVLVLLPALAGGENGSHGLVEHLVGGPPVIVVLLALLQAALFVALMLLVGTKLIPALLEAVDRTGSRELFTLCVLALALGVAYGSAELFGASLALGAFLAGVVLNESDLSHRAGLEALPLRDAFAVLFFVSVGMLLDPAVLVNAPLEVAGVLAIIILGKAAGAFVIIAVLGFGLRTALVVSAALTQVGEFSFILAALATTLGVFPAEGNDLILAGALLSITLNPFIFGRLVHLETPLMRHRWLSSFAERREHMLRGAPAIESVGPASGA